MLIMFWTHLSLIQGYISNFTPGIFDSPPLLVAISLLIFCYKFQLFQHDSEIRAARHSNRSHEASTGSTAAPSIDWAPPDPISAGRPPISQIFYFPLVVFRRIGISGATPRSFTIFQKMHRLSSLHGWVSNPYKQQIITTPLQGGRAAWIFC